ncbi:hypothetical protein JXC34_04760 [Candidatus Woesearchaeota archaeon]|nr:hypothetical protein [Candidatus Woesearchaeota archaeon]
MIELRISFWDSQELADEYTFLLIEGYYEIIKELLAVLLLKNGLSSDNHECLISFLREKHPELDYETAKIYELKKIRNDIAYRGVLLKKEYLDRNKPELKHIMKKLMEMITN